MAIKTGKKVSFFIHMMFCKYLHNKYSHPIFLLEVGREKLIQEILLWSVLGVSIPKPSVPLRPNDDVNSTAEALYAHSSHDASIS